MSPSDDIPPEVRAGSFDVFNWLEANAERYRLRGGFARGTGGIDAPFIIEQLAAALAPEPITKTAIAEHGEPDAGVADMVLVPREPTLAMSWAGEAEYMRKGLGVWSDFHAIYRAMIAAAPSQSTSRGK